MFTLATVDISSKVCKMQAFGRVAMISLLSLAVHASAESRVCIGGDLAHLTPAQTSACWDSAHQIGAEAAKFHGPSDWHYFVICTDSDWKDYVVFSKRSAADLALLGADTDLQSRTTFFRGEWLPKANALVFEKAVAHEVASALLQSTDEAVIRKQIATWLPETDRQTLMASR
jgi:hypothetical protein